MCVCVCKLMEDQMLYYCLIVLNISDRPPASHHENYPS